MGDTFVLLSADASLGTSFCFQSQCAECEYGGTLQPEQIYLRETFGAVTPRAEKTIQNLAISLLIERTTTLYKHADPCLTQTVS